MLRYAAILLNLLSVVIGLVIISIHGLAPEEGLWGVLFLVLYALLNLIVVYRHATNAELSFVGLYFKRRRLRLMRDIEQLEK